MHRRTAFEVVALAVWRGRNPADGRWGIPIRQQWGLTARQQLSPALEEKLAYFATVTGSYEAAAQLAAKVGSAVEDSTIRALVQRLGALGEALHPKDEKARGRWVERGLHPMRRGDMGAAVQREQKLFCVTSGPDGLRNRGAARLADRQRGGGVGVPPAAMPTQAPRTVLDPPRPAASGCFGRSSRQRPLGSTLAYGLMARVSSCARCCLQNCTTQVGLLVKIAAGFLFRGCRFSSGQLTNNGLGALSPGVYPIGAATQ